MKFLSLSIIAVSLLSITSLQAWAQGDCTPSSTACTFDPQSSFPGCLVPVVAKVGKVNEPYQEDLFLVVARKVKSPIGTGEVDVSKITIDPAKIQNIPPGLSFKTKSGNSSDPNFQFTLPPGSSGTVGIYGCIRISGTPTQANAETDSITIPVNVFIKIGILEQKVPDAQVPAFKYHIRINNSTGLEALKQNVVSGLDIAPNPVAQKAMVSYELKNTENMQVLVRNVEGKIVRELFNAVQGPGMQNLELNTESLPAGIYCLELRGSNTQLTKKFVVQQ